MMEVDHHQISSNIFGSFSRRRQSKKLNLLKWRSIEPPLKILHDRSNSTPEYNKKQEVQVPRTKSVNNVVVSANDDDENTFRCVMCNDFYIEPRVLTCLHTICTRCLQELEADESVSWHNGSDAESSRSGQSNFGSGSPADYIGDRARAFISDRSWSTGKSISCPICGSRMELPLGGVLGFPINYLLQHRMVLATLNTQNTRLLCDLCTNNVFATSRCTECAFSLCKHCTKTHHYQKSTSQHQVLNLEDACRSGTTRIRRQIMCSAHPEHEMSMFCSTCLQVICRECVPIIHRGHSCELISKAAKLHTKSVRVTVEHARNIIDQSKIAVNHLQAVSKKIDIKCSQIQAEVERFIENYMQAVEEHRKNLYQQINQAREEKLKIIEQQKTELEGRLREARDVAAFADELLNEGTDVEVLSFVKPILKKSERYSKLEKVIELKASESLQFLPEEIVQGSKNCCPLYGVITTRSVSPKQCILHVKDLKNLRIGRRAEVILETRDKNNVALERGGEHVIAELQYKDIVHPKPLPVHVEDRRDGTYLLSFNPDVAGKLLFTVSIKGQSIKDSPYPVIVRTLRPHQGTFHCCSFCSSGGSKEVFCGCNGKMPGGYKGCGHGHEGHPGRRHWSCCGNTTEHSECAQRNSTHYQFTL